MKMGSIHILRTLALVLTTSVLAACETTSPWDDSALTSSPIDEVESVSGTYIGSFNFDSDSAGLDAALSHPIDYKTTITGQGSAYTLAFDDSKTPEISNMRFMLKNQNGNIKLIEVIENEHYKQSLFTTSEFHLNMADGDKFIFYMLTLDSKGSEIPHSIHLYGKMELN